MGWGVTDYPSAPKEFGLTCSHGCAGNDELYECQAEACGRDSLCAGHVYQCAECGRDFCEEHILDLNEAADAPYSIYACTPCFARRQAKPAAA